MSKNLSDIFPPTEIGGGGGGIEEAPKTGKLHGRKDGAWEEFDPGQLETGNQDGEILTWDTAAAKWVDDDTMIVKGGNVGVGGAPDSARRLHVKGTNQNPAKIETSSTARCYMTFLDANTTNDQTVSIGAEADFLRMTGGSFGFKRASQTGYDLTIDSTGNSTFSGTVNADTVVASSNVNNRNALQALGSSSNVYITPAGIIRRDVGCGIQLTSNSIRNLNGDGIEQDGVIDIGRSGGRFKDAYFSGTVNATTINGRVTDVADHIKAITPTQIASWDAGTSGGGGPSLNLDSRISDDDIIHWNEAWDWGDHSQANYQPAGNYLTPASLNGYATESWVSSNYQPSGNYALVGDSYTKAESDAKYELKGAGGLPDGNWHCTGSITADGNITAFLASDERLKDDIAPMPLGLIDGINPATFKWKDSGKASGGVIAQQLQACGLGDWVNEAPNGDLGVDYTALIGLLLAEVKDLKSRIREVENANANP
jgi:hypothetical protein